MKISLSPSSRPASAVGIHCRDNPDECVEIVLDNGSTLGESHQTWQLNEISKLIWPSPAGIGIMDEELWAQTVAVSIEGLVISEEPGMDAYRSDLAQGVGAGFAGDGRRRCGWRHVGTCRS